MPPLPKKRAPAKKAVAKVESDSDVEMVDTPPSKPAARKKAVTKIESDSEFETPSSSTKGKAKAKKGPKSAAIIEDGDVGHHCLLE